jgi:prophage regulatory protein
MKRIIRLTELRSRTGLARSSIYAKIRQNPLRPNDYDASFPKPIPLGARAIGWLSSEVDAWLEQKAAHRETGSGSTNQ